MTFAALQWIGFTRKVHVGRDMRILHLPQYLRHNGLTPLVFGMAPYFAGNIPMPASIMDALAALHRFPKPARKRGTVLSGNGAKDECECSTGVFDFQGKLCGEPSQSGAVYVVLRWTQPRSPMFRTAHWTVGVSINSLWVNA